MQLAVVLDFLVALGLHHRAVLELEAVGGVLQVGFLHQHALEGGRVEAEGGAALQALLVGVKVDVLEVLVRVVRGHVRGLGDRRVDPLLRSGLDVHVRLRGDVVGRDEVVRQAGLLVGAVRHGLGVDQGAVGQQLVAVDLDLFLGLLAFADHVAAVVVREAGLDAVGGVVGQRQRDRAGGRDRAVVGEARAGLGQLLHQLRGHGGHALHVARVQRVQLAALDLLADLPAVLLHLRALAQHLGGDLELLVHDRGRALLLGQRQRHFPAGQRHLAAHVLGELHRVGLAVLHAQHGDRAAQAQEAHAVAALAQDLVALLLQRQAVDLDHVVEHAGEHPHHFLVFLPVEAGLVRERVAHELGQVHRTQQAGAVGRQRLLAAGVGGADVLAPPVVVHLVDAVDQDEARLGEVVGGRHDAVPQLARLDVAVDLAGHHAVVAGDVVVGVRPVAPHYLAGVVDVHFAGFLDVHREHQRPVAVGLDGLDELVGDQQREVELAQAPVLALGADELLHVRVAHVEGAHLGAAAATGRRDGEAHLVVDIHERQRARGVGAGTRDVGATRAQRRELVADAAAGLEGEAGLVDLAQDVVHRVGDGARHGAVDGAGGRLVLEGAGVGRDAAGGDGTAAQRPQEALVPVLALLGGRLGVGQGLGHALVGVVDGGVHRFATLGLEAVLLVPDVLGRRLHLDLLRRVVLYRLQANRAHKSFLPPGAPLGEGAFV